MTAIVNLVQQSPEWHAHRAAHFNASDAPAMLGASPLKKRTELMREISSGVEREFSDFVQERIINPGHTFEALARSIADSILGDDLYPAVVVDGRMSASLDGLTLDGAIAWEHKRLNQKLRDIMVGDFTGADLPDMYRIQCEHQLAASKAEKVLFMASDWTHDGEFIEERHCWYFPDAELRARIISGWQQFEADLAGYEHIEHAPAPTGRAPGQLMPLVIEATGVVTRSNAEQWEAAVSAYLGNINRELITDQDFADADATVKWCATIEAELEAVKARILSGSESIAEAVSRVDRVKEAVRQTRLPLSSLIQARKVSRRTEIVDKARAGVLEHYAGINAGMGPHAIFPPATLAAEIGTAIKGRKTIASVSDAAESAAANLKIAASQQADRVRACVAVLDEVDADYQSLFADRVQLCASKAPDDLRNLIATRITQHRDAESKRLEAERERIRQEEAEKLAKAAEAAVVPVEAVQCEAPIQAPAAAQAAPVIAQPIRSGADAAPATAGATIKLGDLNARIAPLTISADGLAKLGFQPAAKQGGARLYRESDFPDICATLADVLRAAAMKRAA